MKISITSFDISTRHQYYISEMEEIIHPDLKAEIKKLREIVLNDYFYYPEQWFGNETEAKGFIFSLLMKQIKNKANINYE